MTEGPQSANRHLILRGNYMADGPGVEGTVELAVHFGPSGTSVWTHDSNFDDPELLADLPVGSTWREIVDALISDERMPSPLDAPYIDLQNDRPPLGVFLGCILACRPEDKSYLNLLLGLPPQTLETIASKPSWNLNVVAGELAEIEDFFQGNAEVSLGFLDASEWEHIDDVLELRSTVIQRCEEISRNRQEEDDRRSEVLAAFAPAIAVFLQTWGSTQPREGKFQYAHVRGMPRLRRYIESYVTKNGCLPAGTHKIPAGTDVGPYAGKEFEVTFPQW